MTGPWDALSNRATLYPPDADDLIFLDGVALALAASVATEAFPGVEAGGEYAMENAGLADAGVLAFMEAVRSEMDVINSVLDGRLEDGLVLDRGQRNSLRTLCFLLLGRPLAKTDPMRFPERLLDALGPWYEPEAA